MIAGMLVKRMTDVMNVIMVTTMIMTMMTMMMIPVKMMMVYCRQGSR